MGLNMMETELFLQNCFKFPMLISFKNILNYKKYKPCYVERI